MNPRIKELAEQAGYLPDMFGVGHWDMPECRKFAMLIVRECVVVVDQWKKEPFPLDADVLSREIRKHFGVEE
jgi:hypothetical protein